MTWFPLYLKMPLSLILMEYYHELFILLRFCPGGILSHRNPCPYGIVSRMIRLIYSEKRSLKPLPIIVLDHAKCDGCAFSLTHCDTAPNTNQPNAFSCSTFLQFYLHDSVLMY